MTITMIPAYVDFAQPTSATAERLGCSERGCFVVKAAPRHAPGASVLAGPFATVAEARAHLAADPALEPSWLEQQSVERGWIDAAEVQS